MSGLHLKVIGKVVNGVTESPHDWADVRSRIVIRPSYIDGLYRLSRFRHVWIIFGFHRQRDTVLRVHPRRDPRMPLFGVFATQSPTRPNKIGLTLVELLRIRRNVLTVKGLDAFDGSPVYDIKPSEDEIDF
ncbi:MAG TPA: tRNA (N6-threonylcarbamoyladenosine(37)-N6)-methyltransferase TrmO [Thermoplasmata archaeon]